MIRNKILLIAAVSILGFSSCNDYLEPQELSIIQGKDIYKNLNYIQQMWVNSYSYLPAGYNSIYWSASDEAEAVNDQAEVQKFNLGNWTKYGMPDEQWSSCYNGIRQCCEIIENLPGVTWEDYMYSDPVEYERRIALMKEYVNEARFLKAYYYFELVKRYGGVPIVNKKIYLDNDDDLYFLKHIKRNTFEECINFIASECTAVASELPLSYDASWKGRVTRGAALALKSRVLLYAASDLYNQSGNMNPYIGYISGDRTDRWLAAAQAANEVIDMGRYSLHTSYRNLFVLKSNESSKEVIWERVSPNTNTLERENYPIGYEGGNTGSCPTQNLVDAYEMSDGTLFDWSKLTVSQQPYINRDPRLKASVLVNEESWCDRPLEVWEGGLDGKPRRYATKTGYYMKKLLVDNLNLQQDVKSTRQWFFFRYAEILLNYAEAANQYGGPDYKVEGGKLTAKAAIDLVRQRAGMPSVDNTFENRHDILNKGSLLKLIYNERRVELAFEGHRWWDVRRLMQGQEALGGMIKGVSITQKQDHSFDYQTINIEKRVFEADKMYFYPIPQSEIVKSDGNLEQNPNW